MKIVIIDDNKTVLLVYEIQLKKDGYINSDDNLFAYSNLYKFNEEHLNTLDLIDVIICDYDLGDKDNNGLRFLKNLKLNGFKGECILLTSDDTLTMKTKMQLHKNIHYVLKNSNNPNNTTSSQLGNIIQNYKNSNYRK